METIFSLVKVGVSKLIELVPVWMNASAERQAEIIAKAQKLVDGLDEIFDDADAHDDAATQRAREAIKDA